MSEMQLNDEQLKQMSDEQLSLFLENIAADDEGNIDLPKICFDRYYELDYKKSPNRQDNIIQGINREKSIKDSYAGREILEMLQNADDQGSTYMAIRVDSENNEISFINGGRPFYYKGFKAIMLGDASPKSRGLSSIGNKGLGFRSILNWGDSVEIYSRGVHCSFSKEIAARKWENLRNNVLPGVTVNAIITNAENQRHDTNVPISIFAVPDYSRYDEEDLSSLVDDVEEEVVTVIKVCYKESKKASIEKQLEELAGNTLLFLRNVKKLLLNKDGIVKSLELNHIEKNKCGEGFVERCELKTNEDKEEWIVYKEEGEVPLENVPNESIQEQYQIGFAAKKKDENTYPLFVFFKTDEEVGLPCIVHGTFELSPNRKELNDGREYNTWLKKHIAEKLLDFAEYIGELQAKADVFDCWPYELVHFKEGSQTSRRLQEFRAILEEKRDARKIYATIGKSYEKYDEVLSYSKEFAIFLENNRELAINGGFGNHLVSLFDCKLKNDSEIKRRLNAFSNKINEDYEKKTDESDWFDLRCELIAIIIECNSLYSAQNSLNLNILVGPEKQILDCQATTAYVNTGVRLEAPPIFLSFDYVDDGLVNKLKSRLSSRIPETADNKTRALVTECLRKITAVTYGDISNVKERIASEMERADLDQFKELVKCLYLSYKNGVFASEPHPFNYHTNEIEHEKLARELKLFSCANQKVMGNALVLFDKEYPNGIQNIFSEIQRDSIKNWVLWGSFEEWKAIFNDSDARCIESFFTNILGVSLYIPKKWVKDIFDYPNIRYRQVAGGQLENNTYYSRDKINLENASYAINSDYINKLLENETLNNVLLAFFKDEKFLYYVNKRKLRHNKGYSSYQQFTEVSCSFIAATSKLIGDSYPTELYKKLSQLNIDESTCDVVSYLCSKTDESEESVKMILVQLGAKNSDNMDYEYLYNEIRKVAIEFEINPNYPVQTRYKEIRTSIIDYQKRHSNEIFKLRRCVENLKSSGKLVANCSDEKRLFDAKDVFYWDNDKLPREYLKQLPKLDIGKRVGEQSVLDLFGVNSLGNITFEISNKETNEFLQKSLLKHLESCKKYILANVCDDARGQIKNHAGELKSLDSHIRIVKSCSYKMAGQDDELSMCQGDLLIADSYYYLCVGDCQIFDEILRDSSIISSLAEILCIGMKLSEDKWLKRFMQILTNGIRNESEMKNDFDDSDYIIKISNALGLSDEDEKFWKNIASQKSIEFDFEKLSLGGEERLQELQSKLYVDNFTPKFETAIPEIQLMTGEQQHWLLKELSISDTSNFEGFSFSKINEYYNSILVSYREDYCGKYATFLYNRIEEEQNHSKKLEEAKKYLSNVDSLKDFDIKPILENFLNKIVDEDELRNALSESIAKDDCYKEDFDQFEIIEPVPHTTLGEYESLLDTYNVVVPSLPKDIRSMILFSGMSEEFEEFLKNRIDEDAPGGGEVDPPRESGGDGIVVVGPDGWDGEPGEPGGDGDDGNEGLPRNPRKSGEGFKSEKTMNRNGVNAEKRTKAELEKYPEKYAIVKLYSENLDANGDNSKHYDLTYKRLDSEHPDEIRFLEVKSMTGNQIFMSRGEYKFAMKAENRNKYDLAIVKDKKVHIIESPFAVEGKMHPLEEVYSFKMKIKKS